jgi:hypothetical protein
MGRTPGVAVMSHRQRCNARAVPVAAARNVGGPHCVLVRDAARLLPRAAAAIIRPDLPLGHLRGMKRMRDPLLHVLTRAVRADTGRA